MESCSIVFFEFWLHMSPFVSVRFMHIDVAVVHAFSLLYSILLHRQARFLKAVLLLIGIWVVFQQFLVSANCASLNSLIHLLVNVHTYFCRTHTKGQKFWVIELCVVQYWCKPLKQFFIVSLCQLTFLATVSESSRASYLLIIFFTSNKILFTCSLGGMCIG